ncbi:MAG: hypothetical protein KJO07_24200, partial [Deltaproteobacteria bacterium]|nr:hypothetical protein [Deltaproteobacteria bacterium]
ACNIGLAYVRLSLWAAAHYYLDRCKNTWKEGALPVWVDRRLGESEAALKKGQFATIEVEPTPADSAVRIDPFPGEVMHKKWLWLPMGTHTVTVSAEGKSTETRQVIVAMKSKRLVRIKLDDQRRAVPEPDPGPGPQPEAGGGATITQTDSQPGPLDQPMVDGEGGGRNTVFLIAGGGAAAVAGVLFGWGLKTAFDANDLADQVDDERADNDFYLDEDGNPFPESEKRLIADVAIDEIKGERTKAYLLYGFSGAAAVASGVLVYLWLGSDSGPESAPRVSAGVTPGGANVTMGWSF